MSFYIYTAQGLEHSRDPCMLKEYMNEWMDERMNTLPSRTLETWEASLP